VNRAAASSLVIIAIVCTTSFVCFPSEQLFSLSLWISNVPIQSKNSSIKIDHRVLRNVREWDKDGKNALVQVYKFVANGRE